MKLRRLDNEAEEYLLITTDFPCLHIQVEFYIQAYIAALI